MEIGNNLTEKGQYDYKLVLLAVEHGDQRAYAELMGRYKESVYFMLLKMVNTFRALLRLLQGIRRIHPARST